MENAVQLVELLKQKRMTLAGAESLTGGLVAAGIVSVSGASAVFKEAFVTYCDEAKHRTLSVSEDVLRSEGAISAACAAAMAEGAAVKAGADLAYSTTGNAGPSAAEGKPVGLVFVGTYCRGKVSVRRCEFAGSREEIRRLSAETAIADMLSALKEG